MKTPERIFVNERSKVLCDPDSEKKISEDDIEYIAKSEAEKMAKEFTIFFNRHVIQYKNEIGEKGGVIDLNELFTEFLNSRNK